MWAVPVVHALLVRNEYNVDVTRLGETRVSPHNQHFLVWPFLGLNQQYLEALAVLEIKQQKMVQENMCDAKSDFTEFSGLEVGKQV